MMEKNPSMNRSKAGQQAQTVKVKPRWHMTVLHIVYYLIMAAFLVFYMLPFWGTVMTSFKTNSEVMTSTPITPPTEWTLEGYSSAMEELGMPLMTSLVVTIFGAAGSVFLGSICAYALSKWKFKLNNVFFIALVATTYLPFQAILIPLLQTINRLNLYDNVWGLVLVHSIFGMPMCTVMMRGYYADVPDALIRQAMIDGNGMWQIYRKIVVPNMHVTFVPLTEDNRLTAKEIIGNKRKLIQWQDDYWQHMVTKYPELERGESASQTGRDHIPPRLFKEMTRLTKQREKLEELLNSINPFNGKSKAQEISRMLDKYIPNVERMHTQLKKFNVAFTDTAAENAALKEQNASLEAELDAKSRMSISKQLQEVQLHREYQKARALLARIPKEILDQAKLEVHQSVRQRESR